MASPPQAILFDFGGVLVEWDGVRPLLELTDSRISEEQARLFWLDSRQSGGSKRADAIKTSLQGQQSRN